jgi:chain length determinant protein EpsF
MSPQQILTALRLRWWLVLVPFVLLATAAAYYTSTVPKRFTATTSVLMDVKTDPLLATLAPSLASPAYMATQIEIMNSDRVADRVAKALKLADNPEAVEQWRRITQGRIPMDAHFANLVKRGLFVEPANNSNILNVSYAAADPKFAAAAANTYAQAYIDFSVELKVGPAREFAGFFDERSKTLKTELEAAQAKLSEFQKKKGILVSAERVDHEAARLTSLETALANALAESAETSSRTRNSGTETSVDIQQSGVVQSLKSEIARAETRLNEVSVTFGSSHPVRLQLEAQIAELKQQLASEMRRVSGATVSVNRVANQKISELRALVEAQKRTVLSLRNERDEASLLLKDMETAQRAYEQVTQRRAQLANESQAEQATARVLSPASEPLYHSHPSYKKNVVAAAAVGLILGALLAIAWELLDRRVRSEADMVMGHNVPVLGVMTTRPIKRGELARLAAPRRPPQPPQLGFEGGST